MPISSHLVLFSVGLFCILAGLGYAIFPRRVVAWKRYLYRKLHLISLEKLNKPITRKKLILTSLDGWVSIVVGTILVWYLPVQFSFWKNEAVRSGYGQRTEVVNGAGSTYADLESKTSEVIQPLINTNKSVGISVGIMRGKDTAVFGYGRVSLDSNLEPDGNTIYEIGSITKVFTTLLLADMAENKLINLTDPVREFLPPSVQVPKYGDIEITVIDLACHMSGLPRLPNNVNRFSDYLNLNFIKNPYSSYTPERLYEFLSRHTLRTKPGTNYSYSNLGMGLLGHALAHREGKTFEELVVSGICEPLDMKDTRITLSPEQQSRLAQGYGGAFVIGRLRLSFPATNWDIPTLAGAGALRSTVNDLLKFLSANTGITQTQLSKAMETTQVGRHKIKPTKSVAMGWHIQDPNFPGDSIVWHNGGTGGYRSYMGFNKKHRVGVVILSNSTSSVDAAGVRILKTLLPD